MLDILILFLIYLANIILRPVELLIRNKFIKKAKMKYDNLKSLKIAITGSYGKTSVKHYLANVLKNKYLVSYSPKSYNTPLGISKFINSANLELDDYLVLEFGARRVGDIKELGKLFNINIAVITEIGLMHIDTFKTQKNIIDEKMSLIKYLDSDGFAILNYENEFIRNYQVNVLKFSYGFNHGDFRAKNIKISIYGSEFDLYIYDSFVERIKLNILGKQSILNVMPAIIMCYLKDISFGVLSELTSVSNRLSLRKMEDYYILDDAYNSNILGAKYALEVLRTHNGKRFIITPGFVEMNKEEEYLLIEYGREISKSVDVCILVKNSFTFKLKNYLLDNVMVFYVDDFKDGFNLFLKNKVNNSILLIENDLPDAY